MSNMNCSEFPSIDLAAFENAVRTITNLGVEVAAVSIPEAMPHQVARIRQLQLDSILTEILPLVTEFKTVHKHCHELHAVLSKASEAVGKEASGGTAALQAQLTEVIQTIKEQRQQTVAEVPVNVADVRKELQAVFDLAEMHLVRSHEASSNSRREELAQQYRAKEATLEAGFVQRDHARELEIGVLKRQYLALESELKAHKVHEQEQKVKISELESELGAHKVQEHEHEQTYQARISELERGFEQKQVKLEAELAAKLRRRQTEMDAANARQLQEAKDQIDAAKLQLTAQKNEQVALQTVIDTSRTGLTEQHEKLIADSVALAERRSKLKREQGGAARTIHQAKVLFDEMLASQKQNQLDLAKAHEDWVSEDMQAFQQLRDQLASSQTTLEGLHAQCKALSQEARLREANALRADERANQVREESTTTLEVHTERMNQRIAEFRAEVIQQEGSLKEKERALQEQQILLDDQLRACAEKMKSLDVKEENLDKMDASLRDSLRQLEQVLSSAPSDLVADRLLEATENLRQLEQALSAPPKGELVSDRLLAAIDKLDHLALSARRRSPAPDPFLDREGDRPHAPRRLTFQTPTASMPADPKRFAEASPELSGGRAPLKKPRSASRITLPLRSPTDVSHEGDTRPRLPSYELGSPRGVFRGRRGVVRDSVDPRSVSNWRKPVTARQTTVTADEGADLGTEGVDEEEEEDEDEEELGNLLGAELAGVARLAYDKIQFPTDGSWTEDLNSWFIDLLTRENFTEKCIEQVATDSTWACFRMALVSKKKPLWNGSIPLSLQSDRCDTCTRVKQSACVYFLLCDGVSAANPTNRQGKRWKLFLRTV